MQLTSLKVFHQRQRQPIQRLMDGERFWLIARRCGDFHLRRVNMLRPSTAFLALLAPRRLDENPPHRLGGRREEMGAILPGRLRVGAQAEPGFVDQGGRLQGMARGFAGHLLRGHAAEFAIDKRQQGLGGLRSASLDRLKDLPDLAHVPAGTPQPPLRSWASLTRCSLCSICARSGRPPPG